LNFANFTQKIQHFIWIWLTLIIAFYLSWIALSQSNFLYGIWYDHAGIAENIEAYAPKNRYRDGFETTDSDTRKALFAGIVNAIHNQGEGLEALNYVNADTQKTIPLLHRAEIVHLNDVANLIHFLEQIGWGLLLLWAILTTYLLMTHQRFASWSSAIWNLGAGLMALSGVLIVFGAKTVFYQLHIWIFPPEHPWFFFYQDSLMSTMMKAPDLFAYIAISLTLLALLFFVTLFTFFSRKIANN
jgi:hypothetical protein